MMRRVASGEHLEAGVLSPVAGMRAIRIRSLEDAQVFLVAYDSSSLLDRGVQGTVNYVDPAHLARWIGDVLGDAELSDAIGELIATRKAYGFLVPDIKRLVSERLEQCREVLSLEVAR